MKTISEIGKDVLYYIGRLLMWLLIPGWLLVVLLVFIFLLVVTVYEKLSGKNLLPSWDDPYGME